MATRRERKAAETVEAREREARLARRRSVKAATAALAVTGALSAAAYVAWLRPASEPAHTERAPASGKTIEDMQKELASQDKVMKKSKEWLWSEQGRTELVIDAYRKQAGKSTAAREERVRLLNVLGRTAVPRAQWPKGFDDAKARAILDLLAGILRGERAPGPEPVAAAENLAAFAEANIEYRPLAERELAAFYAAETRPGPRGAALHALARIGSREGLALSTKAAHSSSSEVLRAALYSLGTYLKNPATRRDATLALRQAAQARPDARALAIKLLANQGSREIASLVPQVLRKGASPQEIEAGAFAASRLKLREVRPLLVDRLGESTNPYLSQELNAAIQEIDRK